MGKYSQKKVNRTVSHPDKVYLAKYCKPLSGKKNISVKVDKCVIYINRINITDN